MAAGAHRRTLGLTALELAIAVAVFALIMTLAWPSLRERQRQMLGEDLKRAADANNRDAIIKALKHGAPPDAWSGASPHFCLHCLAAIENDVEMLRLLLELDVHSRNDMSAHYHRVMLAATLHHSNAAFDALIAAGAFENPATYRNPNGTASALLHVAVLSANVEIVQALLEQGASPNCTDDGGETPLHWAAQLGNTELIEMLLAHGADATIEDSRHELPEDDVPAECHAEISAMLGVRRQRGASD